MNSLIKRSLVYTTEDGKVFNKACDAENHVKTMNVIANCFLSQDDYKTISMLVRDFKIVERDEDEEDYFKYEWEGKKNELY
jgi:hypothetical protein